MTYPFIEVLDMNQDKADVASECQTCRKSESDLSADRAKKSWALLSGSSLRSPTPNGIQSFKISSRIFDLSTLYHCNIKNSK